MFIAQCDQSYTDHDEKVALSSALQAALRNARLQFAATIAIVGYVPHVRVNIVLEDEDVDTVLDVDADSAHAHP